jgi:hypothetical protein
MPTIKLSLSRAEEQVACVPIGRVGKSARQHPMIAHESRVGRFR